MIGTRIKEVREKNGLTQSELAKKLGLTRSGVNAWEMGISIPSAQYLIGLANLFKVSTDYLLGVDKTETIDISSLNDTEKGIVYSLLKYFEDNRRAVKIPADVFPHFLEEYERIKKDGVELPEHIQEVLDGFDK